MNCTWNCLQEIAYLNFVKIQWFMDNGSFICVPWITIIFGTCIQLNTILLLRKINYSGFNDVFLNDNYSLCGVVDMCNELIHHKDPLESIAFSTTTPVKVRQYKQWSNNKLLLHTISGIYLVSAYLFGACFTITYLTLGIPVTPLLQ